jgi:glyoxylase-like metal-dependent hydrolase (beta-lactamase superfamily II)
MPENSQSFLLEPRLRKPPITHEIELSVFGKGYGECLVISCGLNEFIVVDSFINNDTGRPIALDYLEAMGIPFESIKQVVLTHWHKDHIAGITEVLQRASRDAKLVISPIIEKEKFLEYILIGKMENNSSTKEFVKIIDFMTNNIHRIIILLRTRTVGNIFMLEEL